MKEKLMSHAHKIWVIAHFYQIKGDEKFASADCLSVSHEGRKINI